MMHGQQNVKSHNAIFPALLSLPRYQVDPQIFLTALFSEALYVRFEVLIGMAVKTAVRWDAILRGN